MCMYSTEPTQEQWDERNAIVDAVNEKGYVTRKQAELLKKFDLKYRRCNTCGKSFDEAHGWIMAKAPDRHGKDVEIGLYDNCFFCMTQAIMEQGRKEGW